MDGRTRVGDPHSGAENELLPHMTTQVGLRRILPSGQTGRPGAHRSVCECVRTCVSNKGKSVSGDRAGLCLSCTWALGREGNPLEP